MSTEDGFDSRDEALFWADRELGQQTYELAIAPRFPGYNELVLVGAGREDPHLIYRNGNSFLIVETDVSDSQPGTSSTAMRALPDGRTAERGTREYLLAALQTMIKDRSLAAEIVSALSNDQVRYILVTVKITGPDGARELQSIKLAEFEI